MSLADFGETADQQLAKGNPVPLLGRTKSGKEFRKPSGEIMELQKHQRLHKSLTKPPRNLPT
jgi:hypothetical protein